MSIEHTLERIALALESLAGTGIIQQGAASGIVAPTPQPPKRKQSAAVAAAQAEPQPTVIPATPAKPLVEIKPATVVTREQVAAAVTGLINGGNREAVLGIFKKFGASNVSTIPVDKYAEVLAEAALVA